MMSYPQIEYLLVGWWIDGPFRQWDLGGCNLIADWRS